MWSPSSLIFIILLGVWAAYFLQYWIRRRDHLATARSVEQFSEAMRVLERRDSTPRTDLSEPAPRSWNVHPGRATTRPKVMVKRAVPNETPSPVMTSRVDRGGDDAAPARPRQMPRPDAPRRPGPPAEAPAAPAARHSRSAPAARRPRPAEAPAPRRVRPSRRIRALIMLVAFAELVGISVLVPLGYLPWWALAPAVAGFVLSFAYVRAGVRAEQRQRAVRRRGPYASRPDVAPATPAQRGARRAPSSAPAHPVVAGARPTSAAGSPAEADVEPATAAGNAPQPDDFAAEQAATNSAVAEAPVVDAPAAESPPAEEAEPLEYVHLVDEDDIPLTWDPVPVPRPTYTMKARAERADVGAAEVTPEPAPVQPPAEEGVPERRVAGA